MGTRQGHPLSWALFTPVLSFVVFPLQQQCLGVVAKAYNLILFFEGLASLAVLNGIFVVLQSLGLFWACKYLFFQNTSHCKK